MCLLERKAVSRCTFLPWRYQLTNRFIANAIARAAGQKMLCLPMRVT
jgi:hypothetical protein